MKLNAGPVHVTFTEYLLVPSSRTNSPNCMFLTLISSSGGTATFTNTVKVFTGFILKEIRHGLCILKNLA